MTQKVNNKKLQQTSVSDPMFHFMNMIKRSRFTLSKEKVDRKTEHPDYTYVQGIYAGMIKFCVIM